MPETRDPKVSQAALTILPAPALALLAHSLREPSKVYKKVRGVNILLTLSEETQTLGYGIDGHLISDRNDLNGS